MNAAAGKQRVAAGLMWAGVCLAAFSIDSPAVAQQTTRSDAVACVTCLVLQLSRADIGSLRQLPPGALEGLTIVVKADDAAQDPPLLQEITRTGARSGIVIDATRAPPLADIAGATLVVLSMVGDSDDEVYRVRTLVTELRAAGSPRIVIAAESAPDRLTGYFDGIIKPGPHLVGASSQALIEVSLQGAESPVLVSVAGIDAQVLVQFTALRASGSEVSASAPLTVEQIIARHQTERERQQRVVRRTIARGTTSLMFEVPGLVAPVRVTARTNVYKAPDLTEMEQHDIRVNGAAIAGGGASSPPQLPLIEAERVATPPLTITLNETYRYSLDNEEPIEDGQAYVVAFDGADASGRAWIDTTRFAVRRLEIVQRGLTGAIVASEQHEEFAPFTVAGQVVWLPVRTRVFQMYEGAGHRTPIHRVIHTPDYQVNPEDFDAQLQAAHASAHVLLRETAEGFRYLLRDSTSDGNERVVSPRAGERIRTAVAGVLLDPNITVPLPFVGFSYVDLNLLDTGAQLNVFFGGSYGQLSWSVPALGGTRWRVHGRIFAIAAKFNDRSFRNAVEQHAENITQRPAVLSTVLLRPLTPRLRLRVGYELDYTAFGRADTTSATFIVPPNAAVHTIVSAVEAESGAWNARLWWNPARRQRWRGWGELQRQRNGGPGDINGASDGEASIARSFHRYGATLARTIALEERLASRIEVTAMAGSDLDRFSRYSFNAFDNRLHGYPTASIRYDRGAVARSVTSWSPAGWRVDGFADLAVVRDPGFGDGLRGYPGLGLALETAGPLRTLWSVSWGYGFNAQRRDGGKGTHAVRIMTLRTF